MWLISMSKYVKSLFLVVFLIGAGAVLHSIYINEITVKLSADAVPRENVLKKDLAENLIYTLKNLEIVDDAIINTESNPVEVNIATSNTSFLSSATKDYIEKLVVGVFPDSTIKYS